MKMLVNIEVKTPYKEYIKKTGFSIFCFIIKSEVKKTIY